MADLVKSAISHNSSKIHRPRYSPHQSEEQVSVLPPIPGDPLLSPCSLEQIPWSSPLPTSLAALLKARLILGTPGQETTYWPLTLIKTPNNPRWYSLSWAPYSELQHWCKTLASLEARPHLRTQRAPPTSHKTTTTANNNKNPAETPWRLTSHQNTWPIRLV